MKQWFTASEIAAAKLPGLPTSRFRVATYAEAHRWETRSGTGRGGPRLEFHFSNFTPDQYKALIDFQVKGAVRTVAPVSEGATPSPIADGATGSSGRASQLEIDAVVAAYEIAKPKARARGEGYVPAFEFIDDQSKAHGEKMEVYRRAAVMAGLKPSRVRELWQKGVRRFPRALYAAVLTPRRTKRESFIDRSPEIAAFLTGLILERRNHISNADAWRVTQAEFGLAQGYQESVERWCRRFRRKNGAKITIATHPDRARSLHMPAHGRTDEDVSDFLEICQIDGSPLDALTIRPGRRHCIAMVDSLTRLGTWVIASSESALATGRLIIKFNRLFGMPRTIRTDHGSGFISQQMRIFLAGAGVQFHEVKGPYASYRNHCSLYCECALWCRVF